MSRLQPKLGVRMPPCEPLDRVADAILLAEQLGFDSVWLPDSQLIWRDTFMALALGAVRTRRISLATAVTNLVTRHPSVIASAARSLQEVAPGRVKLGVGVGWSAPGMAGMRCIRQAAFMEQIGHLRTLLAGGSVTLGEVEAVLRDPVGPCPIYIAAQGPRTLRFAGEAGDGVITAQALAPGLLEHKLQHVWEGAKSAGRRRDEIDVVAWAPAYLSENLESDLRLFKPAVRNFLPFQPAEELAFAGIHETLTGPVPPGFEADGLHISDWKVAIEVCDTIVSDDLARRWVEAFAFVGSAETLREKLDVLARRGVATLVVTPLVGDNSQALPTQMMRDLSAALDLPV